MPKRKKPSKALEKCAREIKDADEFVAHIASIADRYRHEHALDAGSRNTAVRKSLREFQKHSAIVAAWLQQAHGSNRTRHADASSAQDALAKIGTMLYGVPSMAHAESKSVATWLAQAEQAAARCLSDAKVRPRKAESKAAAIAAEALRATFEFHHLKWSSVVTKQRQSDAVKLLCAIAKSAGDGALTPEAASTVLRAVDGKSA